MKVLLIHVGDRGEGGGQVAMLRLQDGLKAVGVDARILCKDKTRQDSITLPPLSWWESLIGKATRRIGLNDIHCLSSFRLLQEEAYQEADIIDFHCIHHNFFSYLALPSLTKNKPAIFTFHDMWPFTGHCHNSLDCERWKIGCGKCPYLDTQPSVQRDATQWEWKLKDWVYRHSNLTIVAPSKWMADVSSQSILKRFPIHHIPHGIDVHVYQPLDREQCRTVLGIPPGKRVIMFLVDDLGRYLKGHDLLEQAIQKLPNSLKGETVLLQVGRGGKGWSQRIDIPVVSLGYLESDRLKVMCYSAADVFVHPTRAETFGLVLLESLACGTPIVSFRVGGVPELVRPGITGCLADPENASDLSHGIVQLLEDSALRSLMSKRCREIACAEYSLDLQTRRYISLYEQVRMGLA